MSIIQVNYNAWQLHRTYYFIYAVVVFTEEESIAVVCKHWLFENVCPTNILEMFLLGHIGLK